MNPPQIILLPGMDGTGELFKPLLNHFQSSAPVTLVRYPVQKECPYEELSALGLTQIPSGVPLVIVAESFSGPVAVMMASAVANQLKGIIFCCTFARFPRPFLLQATRILPLASFAKCPIPQFVIRKFLLGADASDDLVRLFRDAVGRVNPMVLASRLEMIRRVDVRTLIGSVRVPCMVPAGNAGLSHPAALHGRFCRKIAGYEVRRN